MESFRSTVLNSTALWERSRGLLEEVRKKFVEFPNVGFCKPCSDSYQQLVPFDQGQAEVDVICNAVVSVHKRASDKVEAKYFDFKQEISDLLNIWEKYNGLQELCKKHFLTACEAINSTMPMFEADIEVMMQLERYIRLLEKAKESSNPSEVYEELLPLVRSDFLVVSERDLVMLEKAIGMDRSTTTSEEAEDEMSAYIVYLKKKLSSLKENRRILAKEYDWLVEQNKSMGDEARRSIDSFESMIADMRLQLERNGIHDPTIGMI